MYVCGMVANYNELLQQLIASALKEDIGEGDHSTLSCISPETKGKAVLKIKEAGILAGMKVAEAIFRFQQPDIVFHAYMKDGDQMKFGDIAFDVEATVHTILQCERLVLNCMQRMSGIATLTKTYSDKLAGYKTRILDTRKTTPNFRLLEKEAVAIGGGHNHRFALYDMIMLKDNHIDYCGGIEAAIEKAYKYVQEVKPGLKIEVETRSLDDVKKVLATGKVNRIMLDNFTAEQIKEAVALIGEQVETEASGGINLSNIQTYAAAGVDYVSVGALIHQARSLDLSLKAVVEQ
ncbi:carboxylating nicotinate-nucleotide diphosphorylase [Lacibacter sp. H407]|uniref:carboxylating nicotinate-nucleotide diphosphorylase n=1 Tax=Lacibacter sp. H407 TaxID=3133423 RepID=UPI0030C3D05A